MHPTDRLSDPGAAPAPRWMTSPDFRPLGEGPCVLADGDPATVRTAPLGTLAVPGGRLLAVDPHTLAQPVALTVPAGEHEVHATVADVSLGQDGGHLRPSSLSVLFAPLGEVRAGTATLTPFTDGEDDAEEGLPAVGVDAGTAAFLAEETFRALTGAEDAAVDALQQDWAEQQAVEGPVPGGFVGAGPDGGGVVGCSSGWGDGGYALHLAHDASGRLLAVHLDFGVVGERVDPDDEEPDTPRDEPSASAPDGPADPGPEADDRPRAVNPPFGIAGHLMALLLVAVVVVHAGWSGIGPGEGASGGAPGWLPWLVLAPVAGVWAAARAWSRPPSSPETADEGRGTGFDAGVFSAAGALTLAAMLFSGAWWPWPVLLSGLAGVLLWLSLMVFAERTRTHAPLLVGLAATLVALPTVLVLAGVGVLPWATSTVCLTVLLAAALVPHLAFSALAASVARVTAAERIQDPAALRAAHPDVDGVSAEEAVVWVEAESEASRLLARTGTTALLGLAVTAPLSLTLPVLAPALHVLFLVALPGLSALRHLRARRALRAAPGLAVQVRRVVPDLPWALARTVGSLLLQLLGAGLCLLSAPAAAAVFALALGLWWWPFRRRPRTVRRRTMAA